MNQAMIRKMQKLQKEMMQTQKELEEKVYKGTAGGIIEIEVKGTKEIINLKIDKEAIEGPEDVEMLEETILLALNNVMKDIDKESQEKMSPYTAGLGGGLF